MGLIKVVKDSISTVVSDQWLEYFYCDSLGNDVLMKKGQKRVTEGRNSNKNGVDNIISNGSRIIVNEGQCMIIVDQGGVVDFCAEAGEFVYDTSSEPSLLYGDLGENIKNTFKTIWNRFTFGGNTAKDQRVYYFNKKEIMGNLYGTPSPIDFHIVSPVSGFHFDTVVKCSGEYTFVIKDPLIFYKNVCANVTDEFTKSSDEGRTLMNIMKRELLNKLPTALSAIAAKGVLPYQLSGHTEEICEFLRAGLTEKWEQERGIEVRSITISATVPEEARDALNRWNETAAHMAPGMNIADAVRLESQTGMLDRTNISGGAGGSTDPMNAMMSMMAMNMMGGMMNGNNMMGGMMGANNNMMNNGNVQQQQQPMAGMGNNAQTAQPQMQAPVLGWTCSCGKTDNRHKFCGECGSPKPAAAGWTCSCGHVNQGKFCPNCGSKKPEGAPLYKCDKCGWEPEDPTKPPKFCPECGDIFDQNDIK